MRLRYRVNWRLVKLTLAGVYLVFMVIAVLALFRHSDRAAKSAADRLTPWSEAEIPQEVLEFEALARPGAGENGAGVATGGSADVAAEVKRYAFNKAASDLISIKRNLPDVRHRDCLSEKYDASLPVASVIIIFNNERLSPLLRTVWSVLKTTPEHLLHEIVLVDDASNITEITHTLPLYMKYRLPADKVSLHVQPRQQGLIGARLAGAKAATGDAIIFLDSHCEATIGWIEPLLQRIKDDPTHVVIPSIDSISDQTMEFHGHPGGVSPSVGGFTWSGHFTWISYVSSE